MKEATLRKKVIEILRDNWVCWYAPKVRYKETDLFGIWDLVCLKKRDASSPVRFIQITTLSNISARRKKILKFLKENNIHRQSEIWGWDKKKRKFKIVKVVNR